MEKNINNDETRLFDLIESTPFSELSISDRLFVESQITEEEFTLQRRIMSDSSEIFPENITPHQLQTPSVKNVKMIPLYQALLAISAIFILFITIWPNPTEGTQNQLTASSKVQNKKEFIHDTIIKYVNQVKIIEKTVYDTVVELVTATKLNFQEPKLLEALQTLSLPELNKEMIATKGVSLKDDNSSRFTLKLNNFR